MSELDELKSCVKSVEESVHKIEVSNAGTDGMIQGFIKSTNDFLGAIRKDVYSKDGLIDRVGNHGNQLKLQWGLLSAFLIVIIITLVRK